MSGSTPIADDWFVVEVKWQGIAEPYYHLSGLAIDHPFVPKGHRFITTDLQWMSRTIRQAQTRNRLYRLGLECTQDDIRAVDFQRINDYLLGLWNPPASMRLAIALPEDFDGG